LAFFWRSPTPHRIPKAITFVNRGGARSLAPIRMNPPTDRFDRSKLDVVLVPLAEAHGAEVVDVELKNEQGGWVLRVFIEKLGSAAKRANTHDAAVDLSLCSDLARELSPALDAVDLLQHRYHLEISSPGLERTLRGAADFVRFEGEKAKLKLAQPVDGQKVLVGQLGGVDDGADPLVRVLVGSKTVKTPLHNVVHANLVFEFKPAPKPGKGNPKSKSNVAGSPSKGEPRQPSKANHKG
jgi:ribosome maturation factor RimP